MQQKKSQFEVLNKMANFEIVRFITVKLIVLLNNFNLLFGNNIKGK